MSHLPYFTTPGYGQTLSTTTHYSGAVLLPSISKILKCSGQGGWDPQTGTIDPPTSQLAIDAQIAQAFWNVDLILRTAGSKRGWGDVYFVRIYYVDHGDEESMAKIVECLREWCPEHRPVLTGVQVKGLALEGMRIEVEVEAYLGEH